MKPRRVCVVEAARAALETTPQSVKEVAFECGYRSVETMNRAFQRALQLTPLAYRRRFSIRKPG